MSSLSFAFRALLNDSVHGSTATEAELPSNPNIFAKCTLHYRLMAEFPHSAGERAGKNGLLYDNTPHSHCYVCCCQVRRSTINGPETVFFFNF